jgi:phosphate transport system ATP-binding protein
MIPDQENQMVSPPLRMPTEDAPTPPHIEVVPPGVADHGTEIGTTASTVGIEVKNLNAWFGKAQVLYEIAMSIKPRQVTAIIGPSGCGKSTYVRCLNRMHETIPTARVQGAVQVGDLDVYGRGTAAVDVRRRIGMVFQKPNPFPTMSIYDNVAAGLKLNGFSNRRELDEIVERSLRFAALWDEVKDSLRKKSGASLSGGQQQRLCIARALAVQPEVLLMDEPASALDPISTGKIEELIFQLKEQFTVVIVTHNMQQAARVADFTGFFLMGSLIEFDRTQKIFTTPSDKRTEDYVTGRFG